MMAFIVQKLLTATVTVWLAVTLAFLGLRILPGDAITAQLSGSGLPADIIAERRAVYQLDAPIWQQYVSFWIQLMRGDLGMSLYGGQTVSEIIRQRLPTTLVLAGWASLIAICLGIALGLVGALNQRVIAGIARWITYISFGVPIYWTATLAVFIFAVYIGGVRDNIWLPAIVLGFHSAGGIARITQQNISTIQDVAYIRTAHGKGLPVSSVYTRHMLKAALLPIITVITLQMGVLFSGTVITETIFQRAGIGRLLLDAVLARNYPVVQGVVIITAIVYVVLNTCADILYSLIDPRVEL